MADDTDETTHSEPNAENDLTLERHNADGTIEAITIYYAYCNHERRRIGNEQTELNVARNTANNHARTTRHVTVVKSRLSN